MNIDGEVERFETIDAFENYKLLESKKLKPNCIIPIAYFLRNMNDLFPKKGILEIGRLLNNGRKLNHFEIKPDKEIKSAVILHGYGANGKT